MKSTTCRLPAPRPASTRAIACRTSPLACTSRSRCSTLRDDRAAVKRPRYARGRLTFGAGAGMFSGPGNVSAFFERLRAALAPDYELLRELGSGGMGTVYLARDVRLDSSVAVKVLRPELWTVEAETQFVEEARILRRLRHANIVPVHDVDERQGLTFYVMDYLAGDTVQSRLEESGPLSVDGARKLGRDLLEALEVAHQNGVIHRDVKPANVFFDGERGVLTDFGIARRLTQEQKSARPLRGARVAH